MRCIDCGKKTKAVIRGHCRLCYSRFWRSTNADYPAQQREGARRRRAANPEKVRTDNRKQVLKRYGLTPESYDALLEKQGSACAICGSEEADSRGFRLHVDHDHKTKKVRGLLCGPCNHGLGKFKDSTTLLALAIEYLDGGLG